LRPRLEVGARLRIDAPGYCCRGVYEITQASSDYVRGSLLGPDGEVQPDKPYKIIGYREPFMLPDYDPVDERRPCTRLGYTRDDIDSLLRKGEAALLAPGEEIGPIPETNRGAW